MRLLRLLGRERDAWRAHEKEYGVDARLGSCEEKMRWWNARNLLGSALVAAGGRVPRWARTDLVKPQTRSARARRARPGDAASPPPLDQAPVPVFIGDVEASVVDAAQGLVRVGGNGPASYAMDGTTPASSARGDVHVGCGGTWGAAESALEAGVPGLVDRCTRCGEERA